MVSNKRWSLKWLQNIGLEELVGFQVVANNSLERWMGFRPIGKHWVGKNGGVLGGCKRLV